MSGARIGVIVATTTLAAYMLGSPGVQAASNVVTVKDAKTKAKARVVRGRLWVDAQGSTVTVADANGDTPNVQNGRLQVDIGNPTLQVAAPEAQSVIAYGSAAGGSDVGGAQGILTGVTSTANTNIHVRADVDCDGTTGNAEWLYASKTGDIATLPDGGVSYCGPLDVLTDGSGAWALYGTKSG